MRGLQRDHRRRRAVRRAAGRRRRPHRAAGRSACRCRAGSAPWAASTRCSRRADAARRARSPASGWTTRRTRRTWPRGSSTPSRRALPAHASASAVGALAAVSTATCACRGRGGRVRRRTRGACSRGRRAASRRPEPVAARCRRCSARGGRTRPRRPSAGGRRRAECRAGARPSAVGSCAAHVARSPPGLPTRPRVGAKAAHEPEAGTTACCRWWTGRRTRRPRAKTPGWRARRRPWRRGRPSRARRSPAAARRRSHARAGHAARARWNVSHAGGPPRPPLRQSQ